MSKELVFITTETMTAFASAAASPSLITLITRGNRCEFPAGDAHTAALWTATGERADDDRAAVAALSLLGDGGDPGRRTWYMATPVHLQTALDHLRMTDTDALGLEPAEARELAHDMRRFLQQDDDRLVTGSGQRWYYGTNSDTVPRTVPPRDVAGGDVYDYLPSGAKAARLNGVMNSMQMLLHAHRVNDDRTTRGLPAVNSVWLWGGGRLPRPGSKSEWLMVGDTPFVRGLAMNCGAAHRSSGEWRGDRGCHTSTLVWLERDAETGRSERSPVLEDAWFGPALAELKNGDYERVRLVTHGGTEVVVKRSHLRRFWRRRPSMRGVAT